MPRYDRPEPVPKVSRLEALRTGAEAVEAELGQRRMLARSIDSVGGGPAHEAAVLDAGYFGQVIGRLNAEAEAEESN